MLRQRSEALGAQPYERTDTREGYANGFKPKTVQTRMGPLGGIVGSCGWAGSKKCILMVI